MTLPGLPGHYNPDDVPEAAEVNAIIDNLTDVVAKRHTHLAGYFELGSIFPFTSGTSIDVGMAATVNLTAGQIVKLSFCGQIIYGASGNTLDANLCVFEFREGATNLGVGKEVMHRAAGTGGPGQVTIYGECLFAVGASGSHTYKMQAKRTLGSLTFALQIGAVFKVETIT